MFASSSELINRLPRTPVRIRQGDKSADVTRRPACARQFRRVGWIRRQHRIHAGTATAEPVRASRFMRIVTTQAVTTHDHVCASRHRRVPGQHDDATTKVSSRRHERRRPSRRRTTATAECARGPSPRWRRDPARSPEMVGDKAMAGHRRLRSLGRARAATRRRKFPRWLPPRHLHGHSGPRPTTPVNTGSRATAAVVLDPSHHSRRLRLRCRQTPIASAGRRPAQAPCRSPRRSRSGYVIRTDVSWSRSSSGPDNGLGDGDTVGDIQVRTRDRRSQLPGPGAGAQRRRPRPDVHRHLPGDGRERRQLQSEPGHRFRAGESVREALTRRRQLAERRTVARTQRGVARMDEKLPKLNEAPGACSRWADARGSAISPRGAAPFFNSAAALGHRRARRSAGSACPTAGHGVGEGELSEIVFRDVAVLDQRWRTLRQWVAHVDDAEMPDVRAAGSRAEPSRSSGLSTCRTRSRVHPVVGLAAEIVRRGRSIESSLG